MPAPDQVTNHSAYESKVIGDFLNAMLGSFAGAEPTSGTPQEAREPAPEQQLVEHAAIIAPAPGQVLVYASSDGRIVLAIAMPGEMRMYPLSRAQAVALTDNLDTALDHVDENFGPGPF